MRLSDEIIEYRIHISHGDTVRIDLSTYVNARTPARFIDIEFGEWWAQPGAVFNGGRHIKRFHQQQRLSIDEVKKRLLAKHGEHIKLVDSTYEHTYKKCTFIDNEYGKWQAYPHNVLNGSTHPKHGLLKRKKTWLKKYGVDNPFKSQCVQDKATKKRRNVTRLKHWRTDQELVCVGSYEVAFVKWCNTNQIDFDWQIWFQTPWNKMYRVDAMIKTGKFTDTWIEIKGYFYDDDAKRKWLWFHSIHKSELWDKQRLTEIGIL